MMIEYPFSRFDDVEVKRVVDGDDSIERWRRSPERMAGMQQG
jgi:hypothetical protein